MTGDVIDAADRLQAHAKKAHNTARGQGEGVSLFFRNGHVAYVEYGPFFRLRYRPAADGREQIDGFLGECSFTVVGHHLWPLFEDLRAKRCQELRESDPATASIPGLPAIESITFRPIT